MKNWLFVLLVLCNIVAYSENVRFCRPVKRDSLLCVKDDNKQQVKIFGGEWFQVEAKYKGNPFIMDRYYNAHDAKGNCLLDFDRQDILNNHEELKEQINMYFYDDTLYLKMPKIDGTNWAYIIDQTNNTILDTIRKFADYVKCMVPKNCNIIRISPENRVVSIFEKENNIPKLTEKISCRDTEVLTRNDAVFTIEKITFNLCYGDSIIWTEFKENTLESKKENNILIFVLFGIGVIALLLVGYFFLWSKRNRKTVSFSDSKSEDSSNKSSTVEKVSEKESSNPENQTKKEENITENLSKDELKNETVKQNAEDGKESDTEEKEQQYANIIEIKELKKRIETLETEKNSEIEKLKNEIEDKQKQEIVNINKKDKEISKLKDDLNAVKEKLNKIKREKDEEFAKERKKIETERDKAKEDLNQKRKEYDNLKQKKENLDSELQIKKKELSNYKEWEQTYASKLAYVSFASGYAQKIDVLFELSTSIQSSISKMLNSEIDDLYHIMKAISKYTMSINTIDMEMFYADVRMISEGQIVLKTNTLAGLDQTKGNEILEQGVRRYFFDKYLEKYVNALMVLNESMAGLHHLIDGISVSDVKVFDNNREKLLQTLSNLGLKVDYVKLYDKADKIGLSATLIDAGYAKGHILEIENCIVYFENGRRPETKIRVKVQE